MKIKKIEWNRIKVEENDLPGTGEVRRKFIPEILFHFYLRSIVKRCVLSTDVLYECMIL